MKLLFIFTILFSINTVSAQTCLTGAEINSQIQDYKEKLSPLLASLPVSTSYQENNQPVVGYVQLVGNNRAEIHISGTQCRSFLQKDELAFLFCHEVGHVAGGAPFMSFIGVENALKISAEG